MTGWIILAAVLLVLAVLLALPVGAVVRRRERLTVDVTVGPFSFAVYPGTGEKKKKTKIKTEAVPEEADGAPEKKPEKPGPSAAQLRWSLEVLPGVIAKALSRTRRRIVVSPLKVHTVFGGEDPADTAVLYGRSQALVSGLVPVLGSLVKLKHTEIRLSVDYETEVTVWTGEAGVYLRVWDGLVIGLGALGGLLRWYNGYKKLGTAPAIKKKTRQAQGA